MKIQHIKDKFNAYFTRGNERSVAVKKNIVASLVLKCVSILISLQVVPLTIGYVNPTRYGIWLTLSSIIAWLSYFDLGFAHGFRNCFAEAKAEGDIKLAREYVSTTYVVLFLLFSIILLITLVVNKYLNWSSILNIDAVYNKELHIVFGLLACFFCLNIVASIFTTMLMADQKPALASLIQTAGQVLAFGCIYVLTKTTSGSLSILAFAFSGVPCFLLVVVSILMFYGKRYKSVSPTVRCVRFLLTKKILGLGGQFFVIMISMLFIFQFINIILSRVEGPEAVTQYNIAYKYFGTLNMVGAIILNPFWTAFTDAYVKRDYEWMQNVQRKLERLWRYYILPLGFIMLAFSSFFYDFWIGSSVHVDFKLSCVIFIFAMSQTFVGIYVTLINGTGKVRIQMLIYLVSSILAIPVISVGCRFFGIAGAMAFPTVVCLFQIVAGRIQLTKIVMGREQGIWSK